MNTKIRKIFVVALLALFVLTGCNNKFAERPANILPWTWGDQTTSQTIEKAQAFCENNGLPYAGVDETGKALCGTDPATEEPVSESTEESAATEEPVSESTEESAATEEPVSDSENRITGYCPTRREVNDMLFGTNADGTSKDIVVQVSSEDGAWQVNTGDPKNYYDLILPSDVGLIATIHQPTHDLAEVWVADGSSDKDVFRGTFRFAGCYSTDDDMNQNDAAVRILIKENFDGTVQEWFQNQRPEDWQYSVLAGNFECPENMCPSANVDDNLMSNRSSVKPGNCPTFGGIATTAGTDGAPFCKYKGQVVTDKVPTGWKADYWNGTAVQYADAGEAITTGEATFRPAQ